MRARTIVLPIHRWLAWLLGVGFALTAGSGALLVFGPEAERALEPALYRATPGTDVGLDRVAAAAVRARPGREVRRIESPDWPRSGGVYVVHLAGDPAEAVHVDPGTGVVLGVRREGASAVELVREFHVNLAAGEVGATVVGLIGLGLLATVATGAVLWGADVRVNRKVLRVRLGRGRYVRMRDLHLVVGVLAAPVLGLAAATGLILTFDRAADAIVYGLFRTVPPEPPGPPPRRVPSSAGHLALERLRRVAETEAVPGGATVMLTLPKRPGAPLIFRLKRADSFQPNGRSFAHLDPRDGRVVWARDERDHSAAERVRQSWPFPLHIGTYGGLATRTLHALVGLAPAVLLPTGWILWRQRARARRVVSQRARAVSMHRQGVAVRPGADPAGP